MSKLLWTFYRDSHPRQPWIGAEKPYVTSMPGSWRYTGAKTTSLWLPEPETKVIPKEKALATARKIAKRNKKLMSRLADDSDSTRMSMHTSSSTSTSKDDDMGRPARARDKREAQGATEADRFEMARRHVIRGQKLAEKLGDARRDLYAWTHMTVNGTYISQALTGPRKLRRPRTPEEREELKVLENAVIDAETRLMLHDNDGRSI